MAGPAGPRYVPSMSGPARGDSTLKFEVKTNELARALAGGHNEHLKLIERRCRVSLGGRGNELHVAGDAPSVAFVERLLRQLVGLLEAGHPLFPEDVDQAVRLLSANPELDLKTIFLDTVMVSRGARQVTPKGLTQKAYVDTIRNSDIVFGIGPAGTGKTYLAMAMAVAQLFEKRVKRIVLCRPAVEAGEKLGFLPGDIAEKVNPYLRPLYDALHDMIDFDKANGLIERGTIEVAPLAFMRGRTLNDAFVILDESQNTTPEQMKMFLTRLGYGSKAVVTGDMTQVDLPTGKQSGLAEALSILQGVEGIGVVRFTEADVVRHPLVQDIIRAYDALDKRREEQKAAKEARDKALQRMGKGEGGEPAPI
jgi:phosphate starvation-inducible protein PhoH and related proteins